MKRPLAVLLASLLVTSEAGAFCRSTTCDPQKDKKGCAIDEDGCKTLGNELFWTSSCVGFSLQRRGSNNLDIDLIEEAFLASLRAWSVVDCPDGPASFAYGRQADVVCGVEQNNDGPNANVIVFRDDGWPYQGSNNTLGYTTVSFRPSSGEILGADIEINTAQNIFTTGTTDVNYDLRSVLTHELGHALGLSHSADPESTMRVSYSGGTLDLRDLNDDDRAGLCDIYFPQRQTACDLTPRNGFSTCAEYVPTPGAPSCSLPVAPTPSSFGSLLLPALALLWRRSRSRHP